MKLIDINIIRLHPLEAGFTRLDNALSKHIFVGLISINPPIGLHLGCNNPPIPPPLQRLANQFFAVPGAIPFG